MRCIEMDEILTLYIDGLLDEHTEAMMENHMKECPECRKMYTELLEIAQACKDLPMVELPENFKQDLHQALLNANEEEKAVQKDNDTEIIQKKRKSVNWKRFSAIAAAIVVIVISASSSNLFRMGNMSKMSQPEMAAEDRGGMDYTQGAPAAPEFYGVQESQPGQMRKMEINGTTAENQVTEFDVAADETQQLMDRDIQERKVIKSSFISIDVTNYDEVFNNITTTTLSSGGYIQNSNTQYKIYIPEKPEESLRVGNLTLRIPEDRYQDIVQQIKALGTVTNFGEDGQDITNQYRDTMNEVENLRIQEKQLREIMSKANNVKDILEVERELTRVRGEINRLTGDIVRWDELVNFATIQVSLNEIQPKDRKIQPVSDTLWEKSKKGFILTVNQIVSFAERTVIGFVSILPVLMIGLLIGIPIIWFVIKRIRKMRE
ncbi:MAG: DUF4349 domain-containing protein [Bacillota bacterium]